MTKTIIPDTFTIELPPDTERSALEVSHALQLGDLKIRVLKEPHQWKVLKSGSDPIQLVEAYTHPDDWNKLDAFFSSREKLADGLLNDILTAMMKRPTGHPTTASGGSSES